MAAVEAALARLSKSLRTSTRTLTTMASSSPLKISTPNSEANDQDSESSLSELEEEPVSPRKRTRKAKEPIVYVIPDVETLPTTYNGRLGYACLNTILRNQKPSVFCSRTCRIDTIKKEGMEYLKELGRLNMVDLNEVIKWNAAHHITFFRVSSEIFPFAAHEEYGYSLEYADKELKAAGDTAKRLGVRLTTHPGQYTQLGSPRPVVVKNAFRDLAYHTEMMERMGLGKDSVMIIHGGGVYNDKGAALARFKIEYQKLPQNIKDRLVLENDEICYNVDDLLGPVCEDLNIPLVLDYHHDWIYPSSLPVKDLMPRILATWTRKGITPKQHLSEPRRGAVTIMERRAHADRCQRLPEALPDDMDLMIEAKDKEQACFHLFRIYGLHPTIQDDLRPPAEEETTQTAGRKSHKRKKVLGPEGESDISKLKDEDEAELVDGEEEKPKPKKGRAKKIKSEVVETSEEMAVKAEVVETVAKPKRKHIRKKIIKAEVKEEIVEIVGMGENDTSVAVSNEQEASEGKVES